MSDSADYLPGLLAPASRGPWVKPTHAPRLIFATPPQPWEQHARPGTADDDETDPHTTPAPRDCQGMP
jgi:hypothetical protein